MSWVRLFIRSGIRCRTDTLGLRLFEHSENVSFIQEILTKLGLPYLTNDGVLRTHSYAPSDRLWLDAWELCRSGAEAGPIGFENLELRIMDTHISGVVRWLNALGFTTTLSCEGHRPSQPCRVQLLAHSQRPEVSSLLRNLSAGELDYNDGLITELGSNGKWARPRKDNLLNLGERLYNLYLEENSLAF
jgi:hypothetical protein